MTNSTQEFVQTLERQVQGRMGYCLHDLNTNQITGHRANELFATASTYKLPLLLHLALQAEQGLDWNHVLHLQDHLKSRGSGVLKDLSSGLRLTVRDAAYLMIALSDNTATDMLIELLGLDLGIKAVNSTLHALGFSHTRLHAQDITSTDGNRPPFAAGHATPTEMTHLLRGMVQGELTSVTSAALMLDFLRAQQDHSMIARHLPSNWTYAGKTGANEDLRADVGIVTNPAGQQFVLALYYQHPPNYNWSPDSPGTLAIARLAQHLLT